MIEVVEEIQVNADSQKVWAFLSDVSQSLCFNRFHIEIITPSKFSVNGDSLFYIHHNFGFGNYEMSAKVTECLPPKILAISEINSENPDKGFPHDIRFEVFPNGNNVILHYSVSGTYGHRVQDMSFKPILKGVIKEELIKMKNAIESAEKLPHAAEPNTITPT